MKKEAILINGIEVEGYGFFHDGGKFYIAETKEDCRKMENINYGEMLPLSELERIYTDCHDDYTLINTVDLKQIVTQYSPLPTFEYLGNELKKETILMNCIRLAREINKFGDYVFYHYSPHIKLNSFAFHLDGYEDYKHSDFTVSIYEDKDYQEYELHHENSKPNTIEELEIMLDNWLKDLQS